MGIRESINRHSKVTGTVSAVLAVGALSLVIWSMMGSSLDGSSGEKALFTDDDAKTWFADDAERVTPFDHNGKQAVMCFVYTCDGGKTKFVSYMTRLTAESKKQREGQMAKAKGKGINPRTAIMPGAAMEVKRPGEATWVNMNDARAQEITELRCPDGTRHNLIAVDP